MDKETSNKKADRPQPYLETYYARTISDDEWQKPKYIKICKICSIVYTDKGRYYRHLKKYDDFTIKYTCSWCNKLFSRRDTLKKHSITIHGFEDEKFATLKIKKTPTTIARPPPSTEIIKQMPTFRIIQNKGTQRLIKTTKKKKTRHTQEHFNIDNMNFNIPDPISPFPLSPETQSPLNISPSSSIDTVCTDEIGQYISSNEQIISIGRIHGIFNTNK